MSFLVSILFFSCKKETPKPADGNANVENNNSAEQSNFKKYDRLDNVCVGAKVDTSYFVKYEYDDTTIHYVVNFKDVGMRLYNESDGRLFFLSSELVAGYEEQAKGDLFFMDFWLDSSNVSKLKLAESSEEKKKIMSQILKPGDFGVSFPDTSYDLGSCWFAIWHKQSLESVKSDFNPQFNFLNIIREEEIATCYDRTYYAVEGNFQCKMTGGHTIKNGEFKLLFSTP